MHFHKASIYDISLYDDYPSRKKHSYLFLLLSQMATTEPPWPQLLGQSNWSNLLNPLHPLLRSLILRSGDFIQATYDAFNNDKNSPYCGSSRYGKTNFFNKVMLDNPSHYDVASFLYATARVSVPEAFILHSLSREAWDRESNWIGYIAVSSDEHSKSIGRREIYVVWRGTTRDFEWINVFGAAPESATGLLSAKSLKETKQGNNKDGNVINYELFVLKS